MKVIVMTGATFGGNKEKTADGFESTFATNHLSHYLSARFALIELGRLDEGGVPLHALDGKPGGLLFQNVEKLIGGNHE